MVGFKTNVNASSIQSPLHCVLWNNDGKTQYPSWIMNLMTPVLHISTIVLFSFLTPPRFNWNSVESGVKHQQNQPTSSDNDNSIKTFDNGYVPLVVNTSRSIPHSRLITGFVTRVIRRMLLVEQELPTLPEHPSSPRFLVGFVIFDLQFYVFCRSLFCCLVLLLQLLSIVLFVLLRYTDSDYPIGIFKLFLVVSIGYSTCKNHNIVPDTTRIMDLATLSKYL